MFSLRLPAKNQMQASPNPASPTAVTDNPTEVSLMGLRLARLDRHRLLDHVFDCLRGGQGGWLVTANLDFLRRYVRDGQSRELYDAADVRVADGMPLVWACKLQGQPLPERVPGSSLVWLLAERAAREGRSLYLLGGADGANEKARRVLAEKYRGLAWIDGASPLVANPPRESDITSILAELGDRKPDILLVGLGSPKQEQLIRALRPRLPSTWMIGVGISFSFVAGEVKRAPAWMRRAGIEWVHRLLQEPRRLAKRYLLHDLPFALRLFPHALLARFRQRR
jgi:N-acetylglucosaminyldiphosphoundecaprenol N-acetyl-beta-D-mannosaminyltransferase